MRNIIMQQIKLGKSIDKLAETNYNENADS